MTDQNYIKELEARLDRVSHSSWFHCLTREGKLESSKRVRDAIGARGTDVVGRVGQWFSGDEFLAILPTDQALGYAQRVQRGLVDRGMSATFVLAEARPGDIMAQVDRLEGVVSALKNRGIRSRIVQV